jgi:hypothetical protein
MASHHYKSKAAHLAAMAELAWREYNVAMPEIDIGDDIFAVNDTSGNFWRIQVKYGSIKKQRKSISATFPCRKDQLLKPDTPELYYIFVFRDFSERWRYAIISRAALTVHHQTNNFGSQFTHQQSKKTYLNFRFSLSDSEKLTYGSGKGKRDISGNLEKWNEIPKN